MPSNTVTPGAWPPRWRTLKKLAKGPLGGASALIMIAALFASAREQLPFGLSALAAPLALRLAVLGTLFGLTAAGLYKAFCPDEIADSESDDDFVAKQMPILERTRLDDQVYVILPHVTDLPDGEKEHIRSLLARRVGRDATTADNEILEKFRTRNFSAAAQRYLYKKVVAADMMAPGWRWIIVMLFTIGGMLTTGVLAYRLLQFFGII